MAELNLDAQRLRRTVLVVLALAVSVVFVRMISDFVMALLLAAIMTGLFHPLHERLRARLGGRSQLAAGITIVVVLLLFVVPVTIFLGLVSAQAVKMANLAGPWVADQVSQGGLAGRLLQRFPSLRPLTEYEGEISTKLAEAASTAGTFLVNAIAAAARETAGFFLSLFVMLYAMFFFLVDGRALLRKILYYLPLTDEDEKQMVDRFSSVARATIKGTLVIGVVQGTLGGVSFWIAGLGSPALWGTVMAILSALPGVGSALVWIPAALYLAAIGRAGTAIAISIWFVAVVGVVDNFLRPTLVGKDTQMSDLLVLLSTLGGIAMFGILGFIVGPIVATLFVTLWDLYGGAFKGILPEVHHE